MGNANDFRAALDALRKDLAEANHGTGRLFDTNPETRPEWERSERGDGWEGTVTGFFPTQGVGTVDGQHWYYRSRWGGWAMAIASTSKLAGEANFCVDGLVGVLCAEDMGESHARLVGAWRNEGDADEPDPVPDAWDRIRACIAAWRETRRAGEAP